MAKYVPLSQLAAVVGAEVAEMAMAIKIAVFTGVIRDTRVDTGRLRGNWQASEGATIEGEIDRNDTDGGVTINAMSEVVGGDTVSFLTNNLPYSEVWEERDGMIAKNVARIDRSISEVLNAKNR